MESKETKAKKAKTDSEHPNKELSNMLIELADYEKNVNKQVYKYNAYRKAARSVLNYPQKITKKEQIKELEGVGDKICKKILEYLVKGEINKLEKVRQDDDVKSIQELNRVFGIGPTAAQKFFKMGIKSIDDLKANQDKLSHDQKLGLKYVEDFEKKIPRDEMIKLKDIILKEIEQLDDKFVATICGSFRRGLAASSDIDVLVTHPTFVSTSASARNTSSQRQKNKADNKSVSKELLNKIVKKLQEIKFICDTLAHGDTKFMGVCSLNNEPPFRRIDIRLIPHDQYYCGILYFTGSDMFNKNMRAHALEIGYTLNEYSLRKVSKTGMPGEPLKVTSEKDIFDYLNMEFKSPEDRNL